MAKTRSTHVSTDSKMANERWNTGVNMKTDSDGSPGALVRNVIEDILNSVTSLIESTGSGVRPLKLKSWLYCDNN